jgi:hypothetical protein
MGVGIGINGSKSLEERAFTHPPPFPLHSFKFHICTKVSKFSLIEVQFSSVQLKCDTIKVCFFFFVIIAGYNNLNK